MHRHPRLHRQSGAMLITLSLLVGQGCTTPPSRDADRLETVLLRSSAELERLMRSQFGPTVAPYSAFALQQADFDQAVDLAGQQDQCAVLQAVARHRHRLGPLQLGFDGGAIDAQGLRQISDSGALEGLINEVIAANPRSVEEYRAGKDKAFNALVGQVMKASRGKANPQQVNELLRARLAQG